MATATGAKPNVIVVQKAQPKKGVAGAPASISVVAKGPAGMQSPFEKVRFKTGCLFQSGVIF